MIRRSGFAIVLSRTRRAREPNGYTYFLGPARRGGSKYGSDLISYNGFRLFRKKERALQLVLKDREAFRKEFPFIRVVKVQLQIAEGRHEWELLRKFGSYIVASGNDLSDTMLDGSAWADGKRVDTAHDSWAPFANNGARPFKSFRRLVGEVGLGTIPEMIRQSGGPVFLIGIKIKWRIKQ